jgi:hypothetical protein
MRSIRSAGLFLAVPLFAILSSVGLSAQTATPLPIRKPVVQVNLTSNEPYYLEAFKADIDRAESSLSTISGQKVLLSSKDKLKILLDTIDMMLFRQYCDREGIRVSDTDVTNQLAQYKASMGPNATDQMVELSIRRSTGAFADIRTYLKQMLLFQNYLKQKDADAVKAISQPTAADVLKTYDDLKFNLRRPTSYRFTMLLARTQGKSDADKKQAGDTMRAIAAKLKADPSAFDYYLAQGAVDAKSAGFQTMPSLIIAKTAASKNQYPGLYDTIFNLKEGEVSDLIADDNGYAIVRVNEYLPEKQLLLDDPIEGLNTQAATANPSATVLALVVNEMQSSKYASLQKTARDEINAKLRKDGVITITLDNLAGVLEDPEIAAIKALKGTGYNIVLQ